MRVIGLTHGRWALVDDEDMPKLRGIKWSARYNRTCRRWYAMGPGGVAMHRVVLGLENGDPRQGDHVEPNATLDNRRHNLRPCTRSENQHNRRKTASNTSGYKGVSWKANRKCFQASIFVGGKNFWLGTRETAEAAWRELYVPAAIKYHGEFARVA